MKTYDELEKEYSKYQKLTSILLIGFMAVISISLWILFTLIYSLYLNSFGESKFLVSIPSYNWALPALFISTILVSIPYHYFYLYKFGKEHYEEFTHYGNLRSKMDTWKATRRMGYVIIPLSIIYIILSFDTYAKITNNNFIVDRFFILDEITYKFSDISSLHQFKSFKAPDGDIKRRAYYKIVFADGTNYNFRWTIHDSTIDEQKEIVDFISNSTGLEVVEHDPYPSKP